MEHTIPSRASDAGPSPVKPATRQNLFSIEADDLLEGARELGKMYVDNRAEERRLRLAKIDELLETLANMKEVV